MMQGSLIKLRALEPSDVELLYDWENNPAIWEVSHTLTPFSRYTLQQFIEASIQDIYTAKQLRLMIDEISTQKTVGIIDIFDFDLFHRRAGIGILIEENARNKRYAEESILIVKDYLFNTLHLHQIYCNILENNEISLRLFQKSGFEIVGLKKDWIFSQSGFKGEYLLQCLKA